jgi:hypothetical protein
MKRWIFLLPVLLFSLCVAAPFEGAAMDHKGEWIPLFNGENLDGWTPKFKGHPYGVNYNDTFQVKDGLLRVSYDKYEKFGNKFGHLFFKEKFSHYKIRVVYRFVDEQVNEGPGWAFRNNGVMLHCQDPETMGVDQSFPVSIEAQLLGGKGSGERSTGNLCTPGTHVVMDGELLTRHCTNSKSKTYHGDQWVTFEAEVRGSESIKHYINGNLVMEYTKPQYDESDADAKVLIKDGNKLVNEGWISVQAESHPTEFKTIEIMPLDKE